MSTADVLARIAWANSVYYARRLRRRVRIAHVSGCLLCNQLRRVDRLTSVGDRISIGPLFLG